MTQKLKKIYVVFKTHFDIGFTGLVSEVVERYRTEMLKEVNSICEQTSGNPKGERYVWTMSSWPLQQSLEGSAEIEREKAISFLEKRQLIWHLLPFTTHTEFCGLEEWIRGMYVSRRLSEQYGYVPKDAKMTDVPGHTWSVPSLLVKAGVRMLHLGCNGASTPPDVPSVFFWEGPDGARLLTFYSKGGYGTGIVPPEEWEHPVWLAMIQTNDNHGPHEPAVIQEMKAVLAERGIEAELHIGSLHDFAEDFLAGGPELPVIRGDLADSWIHGVGTAPREVSQVRELRSRIAAAEGLFAMEKIRGESSVDTVLVKRLLDQSYERTLLFGEHTWGMDCKTFLFPRRYEKKEFLEDKRSERVLRMEQSWQEQREYLHTAEAALTEAVRLMSAGAGEGTPAYRVYNYLGWTRDAEVLLPHKAAEQSLVDAATGEKVPLRQDDQGVWAEVKSLPALGYKTLIAAEHTLEAAATAEADPIAPSVGRETAGYWHEEEAVMENEFLRVAVSRRTGWITSLWDKRLAKEFVRREAGYGFGQYEYNVYSSEEMTRYLKKYAYRFYDWGVHDFGKTGYPEQQKRFSSTTSAPEVRLIHEADRVKIECIAAGDSQSVGEYGNAGRILWTISLKAKQAFLDMELRLEGKQETPKAESGSLVLPLKLDQAQYRVNKMGSLIDPMRDIVPSSSTLLHCCEYFVDVTDGAGVAGMAVIPLDTPLLFIGKNGMWDFEHDYKPEKPELHFNLFNNWWGTNFPQWTGGDLRFRYRLVPHAGSWSDAEVWRLAEGTMAPALAIPAAADGNEAAAYMELLPKGIEGASVTCFKPAEDGNGFILRLRDWTGTRRELTVILPGYVEGSSRTGLLEYDEEELVLKNVPGSSYRQVTLTSGPFEVHTLRIRY
jgi:alpha-mannosidase